MEDNNQLEDYVSVPIHVKAVVYDDTNGPDLPGFKFRREGFNHAVFDRYQNGTGTLIVQIGEVIVYFPTGQIKSYTKEQFEHMFEKEI